MHSKQYITVRRESKFISFNTNKIGQRMQLENDDLSIFSIEVKDQQPHPSHPLRMINKDNLKSKQWLYMPIEDALEVELVDVNGNRILSGPYASLNIEVVPKVHGTLSMDILSSDSNFQLKNGHATFQGSITALKNGVTLFFEVRILRN